MGFQLTASDYAEYIRRAYKKINENPVIHNFINLNEEVNLLLLEVKKYLL